MTKWNQTINIKQHITCDESWEGIALSANGIAKELKDNLLEETYLSNYLFQRVIEFLEGISPQDCEVYNNERELLNEVNFCLNEIYDFCDSQHIWLG